MADTESARNIAHSPTPFSTWVGIVCLFVVFGVIVFAIIGPMPRGSNYEQTRAQKRMERLKTLREESQKELTTYAWVDKNKGVARIPIDRAMELTVADLAKNTPAPAGPIATPPAQTAPTGAPPAPVASPASGAAQPLPASASAPAASPAKAAAESGPPAAANVPPASSASPASPAPATTP
jgi:hypothetical protein